MSAPRDVESRNTDGASSSSYMRRLSGTFKLTGLGGFTADESSNNPNSLSKWASSFQRSNYFIGDGLEVGSPGTLASTDPQFQQSASRDDDSSSRNYGFAQRPRLERINSEWQGDDGEGDDTFDRTDAGDPDNDDAPDNESFIYRGYGTAADEASSAGPGESRMSDYPASIADRRIPSRRVSNISRLTTNRTDAEGKPLLARAPSQSLRPRQSRYSIVSRLTGSGLLEGSTVYQTTFNSVNILMGIGILSLPLGMAYAGWFFGILLLAGSGAVTLWTATLLVKCMDRNDSLMTYADVAFYSFGVKARYWVSLIFSLELIAACTALVVLFGDSLSVLVPVLTTTQWKLVGFFIFLATSFVPLNILSITSILGIFATTSVIVIVLIDGFVKKEAPGSLLFPVATSFWPPDNGARLPLAIGLVMGPLAGHSVFCNVYRDMRHPHKFKRAITTSYGITFGLDLTMAVSGYLMFGALVKDEITKSIFETTGYPELINRVIVVMIAVVPLTKMALNTRPIATTLDILLGIDQRVVAGSSSTMASSALGRSISRALIRVFVNALPVALGIYVPEFDRIMALLGSALCYAICVCLPIAFYLKIYREELSRLEKLGLWTIELIGITLAVTGTVWTFL
ncbi:hypothetical protein PYCC9005_002345 [Savitreella phatthalungensis]